MCEKKQNAEENKEWKDKIAVMVLVKQEIWRLDKAGLWPYHLPEVAATEEQLMTAEAHLGHGIDKGYRDFLKCANGWKGFSQTVNLFGTGDLVGSSLMNYALEMIEVMDEAYPIEDTGFSKEELLPIAATFEDRELHVITRATSHQPGVVIWFSGQEIERYQSFEEYFLAMTDYNRLEIDRLRNSM